MANWLDLDSIFRDRFTFPNPADYEVGPELIKSWFAQARATRAHPQNSVTRPLEFATTVDVRSLIIPYDATLTAEPKIYLDLHCSRYNDQYLLTTIGGVHRGARFVLIHERVQFDALLNPIWIHYRCPGEQTLRFARNDSIVFRLTRRDGTIIDNFIDNTPDLPPDPARQIYMTAIITPLLRDSDFNNPMIETMTQ